MSSPQFPTQSSTRCCLLPWPLLPSGLSLEILVNLNALPRLFPLDTNLQVSSSSLRWCYSGPLYRTIGQQHSFGRSRYLLRLGEKTGFFMWWKWFKAFPGISISLSRRLSSGWIVMVDLIRGPGVGEHGVIRNRNLILEVSSEGLGVFRTCLVFPYCGSLDCTRRHFDRSS